MKEISKIQSEIKAIKKYREEATAKIKAERRRVEAEATAKIEEERKKAEAEAKAREEARMKEVAAKVEAEHKKTAAKSIARSEAECKNVEDEAVIKNDVTAESTSNAVSNVTVGDTNDRIVISFLPEDWEMVKEYCEVNDIFYSEK